METQKNIEKLYRDISLGLYKYSFFHLRNREDAEDVTMEVFTRMMEKKNINEIENLKSYSLGMARNIVFDKFKKNSKQESLDDMNMEIIDQDEKSNDEMLITTEQIEIIKDQLDKLDERTREVIILKIWENMKFSEISEVINEKESTAKLRYYRGLEKLKINIQKNNQQLLTLGTVALGIGQIGMQPELIASVGLLTKLSSLVSGFLNLNINLVTMENIATGAGVVKTGFLANIFSGAAASATTKAAIGITSVVTVTGVGTGTYYVVSNQDKRLEQEEKVIVTPTPNDVNLAPSVDEYAGWVEEEYILNPPFSLSKRYKVSLKRSPEMNILIQSNFGENNELVITNNDFKLNIGAFTEAFPREVNLAVKLGGSPIGDIERVRFTDSGENNYYSYSNSATTVGPCLANTDPQTKCNYPTLMGDRYMLNNYLTTNDNGIKQADLLMKSINIEVILHEKWNYFESNACKVNLAYPPLEEDIKEGPLGSYYKWWKREFSQIDSSMILGFFGSKMDFAEVRYNVSSTNIVGDNAGVASGWGNTGVGVTVNCIDNTNNYDLETYYKKAIEELRTSVIANGGNQNSVVLTNEETTSIFGEEAKKVRISIDGSMNERVGDTYFVTYSGKLYEIFVEIPSDDQQFSFEIINKAYAIFDTSEFIQ